MIFVPSALCDLVPNDGKLQYQHRVNTQKIAELKPDFKEWLTACGIDYWIDTRWHDGVHLKIKDDSNFVTLKLTWPHVILI